MLLHTKLNQYSFAFFGLLPWQTKRYEENCHDQSHHGQKAKVQHQLQSQQDRPGARAGAALWRCR